MNDGLKVCWKERERLLVSSVTRLEFLKKFSAANFLTKVAQKLATFWVILKSSGLNLKLSWLHFGQRLEILGYFSFLYLITLLLST